MEPNELAENFDRYFYIKRAVTEQMRQQAFNIRYQVYCKELGYESCDAFPDEMEQDLCDPFSDLFVIYHRSHDSADTDDLAGTVRLVVPQQSDEQLPILLHCGDAIEFSKIKKLGFDYDPPAEVSRLAVTEQFRRRRGEDHHAFVIDSSRGKLGFPNFPYIAVGLYLAAAVRCDQRAINPIIVMMEPRLARHLKRFGILFEKIGETVDFHGSRAPYIINQHTFYENLKPPVQGLYDLVADQIR